MESGDMCQPYIPPQDPNIQQNRIAISTRINATQNKQLAYTTLQHHQLEKYHKLMLKVP